MRDENSWPWVLDEPEQEIDFLLALPASAFDTMTISRGSYHIGKVNEEVMENMRNLVGSLGFPTVEVKGVRACRVPWLKETGENRDGD